MRSETSEMPVFCRFDILVKYDKMGSAQVTTGELTELGGCFLGWEEGPAQVFNAILMSYFHRHMGEKENCLVNTQYYCCYYFGGYDN
jgi:hypothetical protein